MTIADNQSFATPSILAALADTTEVLKSRGQTVPQDIPRIRRGDDKNVAFQFPRIVRDGTDPCNRLVWRDSEPEANVFPREEGLAIGKRCALVLSVAPLPLLKLGDDGHVDYSLLIYQRGDE